MRRSMPGLESDAPILLVANPASGSGKAPALLVEVASALRSVAPIETICHRSLAETHRDLAVHCPRARAVVAIGGDGLIHCIAQHLTGSQIPLGIVPAGSGNDIARALGIAAKPRPAIQELRQAMTWPERSRTIDVLDVRGADFSAYVLAVLSLGLDAKVNYRAVHCTSGWGSLRYVAALVAELKNLAPDDYTIRIDDGVPREFSGLLAAIANLGYIGSGMHIAPMADAHDSIAELITVSGVSRTTLAKVFPRIYRGSHMDHPAVAHARGRRFEIDSPSDIVVHGDGEALGHMPVTVSVLPQALTIFAAKENRD